jgi:hypothetical protein
MLAERSPFCCDATKRQRRSRDARFGSEHIRRARADATLRQILVAPPFAPATIAYLSDKYEDLSRLKPSSGMSAKLTQFVIEWLRKNAVGQIAGADDIPYLVAKCVREASAQGITRLELEAELGPLDECIRQALNKQVDEPPRGSKKGLGARRARPSRRK